MYEHWIVYLYVGGAHIADTHSHTRVICHTFICVCLSTDSHLMAHAMRVCNMNKVNGVTRGETNDGRGLGDHAPKLNFRNIKISSLYLIKFYTKIYR